MTEINDMTKDELDAELERTEMVIRGVAVEVSTFSIEQMDDYLTSISDDSLDMVIKFSEAAEVLGVRARLERGRRMDARKTGPKSLSSVEDNLSKLERNHRYEESLVAAWDDETDEFDDDSSWSQNRNKAQSWKRESTVADLSAVADLAPDDVQLKNGSLLHGDFRDKLDDLPDGSVDLIVTDPPYPHEDIELWSELGGLASRLLGPRGILFAWSGQMFLPEVMDRLSDDLTYGWTFCLHMPHGANARIMGRHMIQGWKPILAYTTGAYPAGEWGSDVLVSPGVEKELYEWQQNAGPAQTLIERYSAQDGLVVDPMMGVGSFGVAAQEAGRRFIGVEIDGERFEQAAERLL